MHIHGMKGKGEHGLLFPHMPSEIAPDRVSTKKTGLNSQGVTEEPGELSNQYQ